MIFSYLRYTCRSQPIHSLLIRHLSNSMALISFLPAESSFTLGSSGYRFSLTCANIDVVVAKEDTHRLFRGRVVRLKESSTPRVVPCLDYDDILHSSRTDLAYFSSPLCPSPEQESRPIYVACVI